MSERDFVARVIELARTDRKAYRRLRAEAWALAAQNHQSKTPEQRSRWLENAS